MSLVQSISRSIANAMLCVNAIAILGSNTIAIWKPSDNASAPTAPVEIGANTYFMVAPNNAGAFGSVQVVDQELMERAARFCAGNGLHLQVIENTVDAPHFGDRGAASIQFTCTDHPEPVQLRPDNGVSTVKH